MLILFLVDFPFTARDYDRFGVDILRARGATVECWDVRPLLGVTVDDRSETARDFSDARTMASTDQLHAEKGRLADCAVIDLTSSGKAGSLLRWMRENGATLVVLEQSLLPYALYTPSFREKIAYARAVFRNTTSVPRLLARKLRALVRREKRIVDVRICSGAVCARKSSAARCIWSHALDYDLFLQHRNQTTESRGILFLDNNMTAHIDYKKLGLKPYATAAAYFPAMNHFFDRLERDLGQSVAIAAHPRSNLEETRSLYNGRAVVIGETPQRVRDAELVVAHDSTAINFSVLWKKPLLIATTDEIERRIPHYMQSVCGALQTERINVDHLPPVCDWRVFAHRCVSRYPDYRRLLIKTEGTPEKNSWEIFMDEMEKRGPDLTPVGGGASA